MAPSRRERPQLSPQHEILYRELSKHLFNTNTQENIDPLTPASEQAVEIALAAATNDPYGDGDQTPLPDPQTEAEMRASATSRIDFCKRRGTVGDPLRAAWISGLDTYACMVERHPSTTFHLACMLGDVKFVEANIRHAQYSQREGEQNALKHLLEFRIGKLRMAPLHYCALGSKVIRALLVPNMMRFGEVTELLIGAGCRIDSKDLVGSTPLSIAAGMHMTKASGELVPVLLKHGADPNQKMRFGQALIAAPIASSDANAIRILITAGADMAIDTEGVQPILLAAKSTELMSTIMEARRKLMLRKEACGGCGIIGVSKFCAACRLAFYCSRDCQVKGWKEGHKQHCTKATESDNMIDIEIGVDTFDSINYDIKRQVKNTVSGVMAKDRISAKKEGVKFLLKLSTLFPAEEFRQETSYEPYLGCVKLEEKNGDLLVLKKKGRTKAMHHLLRSFVEENAPGVGMVYVVASWVKKPGSSSSKEVTEICRLDISRHYPPPKPAW